MKKLDYNQLGRFIQPNEIVSVSKRLDTNGMNGMWIRIAESVNPNKGSALFNIHSSDSNYYSNDIFAILGTSRAAYNVNILSSVKYENVISKLRIFKVAIGDKWNIDVYIALPCSYIDVTISNHRSINIVDAHESITPPSSFRMREYDL